MREHTFAVIGDLHFEDSEREVLDRSRRLLMDQQLDAAINLGDLGGYSHCGTERSFTEGFEYFSTFECLFYALIGNHDLEGADYHTDQEAVAAWCNVFNRDSAYFTFDLGSALGVCLSSTSFRRNAGCHHEVHIEQAQRAWFEEVVQANPHRPIFVFSHAPIVGSGIHVLQNLHLAGMNAYVNNYSDAEWFIELVLRSPQIKLWFSGHSHLGQNYPDSLSQVHNCLFAHVGVMADISRDGKHQGRIVRHDEEGLRLFTIDYDSAETRLDAHVSYADDSVHISTMEHDIPGENLLFARPLDENAVRIGRSAFMQHQGALIEYLCLDDGTSAAIGIVEEHLAGGRFSLVNDKLLIQYQDGTEKIIEAADNGLYARSSNPNPFIP